MATQTYVNGVTLSDAGEANRMDTAAYPVLSGVAGTNTITATGPANYTYSSSTPPVWFTPANTTNGATTINITPSGSAALGAKNIFYNGAATVGGELRQNVPAALIYDGTQFHIIANGFDTGAVVQRKYQEYLTNGDLTTTIPYDNTIPQITEGTEILTQAITPKSASNRIRIRCQCMTANDTTTNTSSIALFVDATANALAASGIQHTSAAYASAMTLEYEESAASTSARTYRIRVGPNANTMRLNGTTAGRIYGGVARLTFIVEEIA